MTVIENLELALQDALELRRPFAEVDDIRRQLAAYHVMQPTLDAAAAKAAPRRFTGEPPTGFGGLS